ncbi:MAG: Crp/Fnr family transcriptional regulator [Blastocatellia bacterium]
MALSTRPPPPADNHILAALPQNDYHHLFASLEPVKLTSGDILQQPDQPIAYSYFVTDGVISVVASTEEGGSVEVGIVGREGMVNIESFLGADTTSYMFNVQIPGNALRMKPDQFQNESNRSGPLQVLMRRFTQLMFSQVMQSVVCNRFHNVEERLSRWLLMCQDRLRSDELALTQEFLAQMLGSRRAGVNVATGILQKAGVIHHHRGRITVLDRQGLESTACECYEINKNEFDKYLSV